MDGNVHIYHGRNADLGVLGRKVYVFPTHVHSQARSSNPGRTNRWAITYRSAEDVKRLETASRSKDREYLKTLVDRLANTRLAR